MWIKKSIKNRFLSKKTSSKLTSLLAFQLNCLQDDAFDYVYFSAQLKDMLVSHKKQTHVAELIENTLSNYVSTELDELVAEISLYEGAIPMYDALEILDLQVSLSRAAHSLRKMYMFVWEIDYKGLKIVKR